MRPDFTRAKDISILSRAVKLSKTSKNELNVIDFLCIDALFCCWKGAPVKMDSNRKHLEMVALDASFSVERAHFSPHRLFSFSVMMWLSPSSTCLAQLIIFPGNSLLVHILPSRCQTLWWWLQASLGWVWRFLLTLLNPFTPNKVFLYSCVEAASWNLLR